MGNEVGVKPGEEMKRAIDAAQELGVPYSFCDRDVQVTLRRAWARCSLWSKGKLLVSLLSSAFSSEKLSEIEIENLKQRNELEGMMSELADYLPEVKETLLDERDRYLAARIWSGGTTLNSERDPGIMKKQVAVVGAGHLLGLKAHLEKIASGELNETVSDLEVIPVPKGLSTVIGWCIPVFILILIGLGFFRAGPSVSLAMLIRWALLNGSLAAVGTIAALGHPLSVLVSFFGAPIATINPFIAVGFLSGITEVTLRKPRVSDTETLSDDIMTLKGVYRNRISKGLLVFFLSSLGGAIGNFISLPSLANLLAK
jgi:pheromone shutdown-related protein TraB